MNKILAKVTKVQTHESLTIVGFDFKRIPLSMMSLEVEDLQEGTGVILGIKPSNVAIAKDFSGVVSYSNQLQGKISKIENGELLCSVKIDVKDTIFQSIITRKSSQRLELQEGDEVTLFMKASELSILEVIR